MTQDPAWHDPGPGGGGWHGPGASGVTSGLHTSSTQMNCWLGQAGAGLMAGVGLTANLDQSCEILRVCVGGRRAQRGSRGQNGIILGQALKPGTALRWWESDPGLAGA